MKFNRAGLHLVALLLVQGAAAAMPPFIPLPAQVEMRPGSFKLSPNTPILEAAGLEAVAKLAAADLGLRTIRRGSGHAKAISLDTDPALPSEGYRLDIATDRITVVGGSAAGVFYGLQTLRQAIPTDKLKLPADIPCLSVTDQPRFPWRGLMLDCSRTFQSVDYLRKTVDRLAYYKLNVLHLHLTDDQGWRMEIKKHPELTREGAKFSARFHEPKSHEGFYTQAELRELVRYASLRGVTLVPEIEMPGHSHEVMVCHPELACAGKSTNEIYPFFKGPTTTADVYCAGNEDTFQFLQEVLDEVIDIFPSQFIHIGGDEVPKTAWKSCPKCQQRIQAEGLENEHDLQSYFIRRMEKYVNAKGRRLMGWSEIMQGGLAPHAVVMDWIGGAAEATKAGHDVVMSPTTHCYFDYPYDNISTATVYAFNPVAGLAAEPATHILGAQANFWSHIDREPVRVDRQIFPRLLALAERDWSPATTTNWPAFSERLEAQLPRLGQMGIRYYGRPPVGSGAPKASTSNRPTGRAGLAGSKLGRGKTCRWYGSRMPAVTSIPPEPRETLRNHSNPGE